MATIVDVARRAGVSASTVSHVVNGTRPVRPETSRLVEEAIAATGYSPNSIARSLARQATNSVGIAISAISNPYFSDMICAIESECARLGLMVFLSDTQDDPDQELRVVQALHQRRAMALLVEHLIGHGHRRIGMIAGHPGFATTLERVDGFHSVLRRHGIAADPALLSGGSGSVAAAATATSRLLGLVARPTAIVAGNNLATIGAMRAIRAAGLRVPADIALVGFDDFEWADCFEPRLTVVAQPCVELGRRAAALLIERIRNADAPRRTIRLQPTLVVRTSCGCAEAAR